MGASSLTVTAEPALRQYWYPVARLDAIDDAPIARRLLGADLVLWRSGAEVVAAIDRCPHRGARLSLGWMRDTSIVCPYHGFEYGSDGAVVHIPSLGEGGALPRKAVLDVVLAEVRYDWIWVCLDPDPIAPIPHVEEHGSDGWRAVSEPEDLWSCPAPHLIDNNLSPAHIAFVHRGTFGSPDEPEVPVPDVERTSFGLRQRYEVPVQSRPGEVGGTIRSTTSEVHAPFFMVIRIVYPDGVGHTMLKAATPVDDHSTRQLQQILRSDSEADRPAADIAAFDAEVWAEDKVVLESGDPAFHLDIKADVHVSSDRTSVEYRRLLAEVVDGSFPGNGDGDLGRVAANV